MQLSYQAGFRLTALDAWLHARAQNLERLKIYFEGGVGVEGLTLGQ